ncbi:bcl-2-related ovarian killer protein homolog B isoform X1 [Gadus morhua]|uniref:bcl-2-related ovarian killer protein homolog B isoform X1 n=1 Tax=Gadus morhua TaxID=8049 RepID=UPI0011B63ABE|nr:bcl-2-related ovarian killer protein homolog B-like isoform X1 [Gadus morhua]
MEVLRKSSEFAAEVLDVFDRSVSDKELVFQAKALYRDYVLCRLNQHGFGWARSELHFPSTSAALAEVSLVLLYLGRLYSSCGLYPWVCASYWSSEFPFQCSGGSAERDELECMHPSLYRNVARQLNISVAMENMVSDAFIAVATEIFSTGITWGKVVSMFAVAAGLAVDCVRQGRPATVHVLVDSLGQLVRRYLVPWLKRKGGWTEISKCVIKKDVISEHHWLSSTVESLKYFLTTVYVYVMKEQ